MQLSSHIAAPIEQIIEAVEEAKALRSGRAPAASDHHEDNELSMPLIVDESACLGLSVELPTSRVRTNLLWLADLATLTLEHAGMGLTCLVFIFPRPFIYPSPLYNLLDALCKAYKQDDLNMQAMPVATFGGWEMAVGAAASQADPQA